MFMLTRIKQSTHFDLPAHHHCSCHYSIRYTAALRSKQTLRKRLSKSATATLKKFQLSTQQWVTLLELWIIPCTLLLSCYVRIALASLVYFVCFLWLMRREKYTGSYTRNFPFYTTVL